MFHSFRRKGGAKSLRPVTSRRARLLVQSLEGRVVPATFTVINLNDTGAGSLRQAILDANALAGADTIVFQPGLTGTILLSPTAGQLLVIDSLTIAGPGAANLTVNGGGAVRLFEINNPAALIAATISGMTLTGGAGIAVAGSTEPGFGGAILNSHENVTLESVIITGNATTGGSGGGIYNRSGSSLTVRNSTISGNSATRGGGIAFHQGGSLLVEDSTISGNTASYGGGGIVFGATDAGDFTIRNSTIANNAATGAAGIGSGGGVELSDLRNIALFQNCTIAGNAAANTATTAGLGGGGIALTTGNASAVLSLVSTIVSGNTAANGRNDLSAFATAAVNVTHSAIGDLDGFTFSAASGRNLLGAALNLQQLANNGGPTPTVALGPGSAAVNAGANPANLPADQRGIARVQAGAVDIGAFESTFDLPAGSGGPFADVTVGGGETYTIAITYVSGSALDVATLGTGDVRVTGPNGFDQLATFVSVDPPGNGTPRTATYALTAPGGTFDPPDYGLYTVALVGGQVANTAGGLNPSAMLGQFRVAIPATFTVTNLLDSGPGSLRQAILDANAAAGVRDTIVFQAGLTGTIPLAATLDITDGATIVGPGAANLTLSGGGVVQVLRVDGPDVIAVTIAGLTIAGGNSAGVAGLAANGGGINFANENLTLDGVVVSGNTSGTSSGGGVGDTGRGVLTVRNSTISGNSAGLRGGGIYFWGSGSLLLENSTVSGNAAADAFGGGGLYFLGSVQAPGFVIRNSTIVGNSAPSGGGIVLRSPSTAVATIVIQNSTITGNTATGTYYGGGGIAVIGSNTATINIVSSIVSGNTANVVTGRDDIFVSTNPFPPLPTVNVNFSAIGDPDGFTPSASSGNNLPFGTALGLGTLGNNGGPMQTISFAANSPLRNAGSNPANLLFDQRGPGFVRVDGPVADIGAFELQVPSPRVVTVAANAGQANAAQRSRVTTLTVTFSTQVTFAGNVADAFTVTRIGGASVGGFTATATLVNGITVVTLTSFTGAETQFGSLADGRYSILVRANQVSAGGQQLDGDGNGTGGDDYTLAGTTGNGLYRLYGDANGDGTVNAFDFGQFRNAFGTSMGQAAYLEFLDLNGDGSINAFDFGQFRSRFGAGVP